MHPASQRPLEAVVHHDGRLLARCVLNRGRYTIGSDPHCDISLSSGTVSAKHALLIVESSSEIFIEDFGSVNGTRVDGLPLRDAAQVGLASRIGIGAATLEFQRAGLPAAVFDHLPQDFPRAHRYLRGDAIVQAHDSTIFAARDLTLDREVAIRVMRPEFQARSEDVLRFVRKAQIPSQLQHPNILPIYELGLDQERRLFYATRFIDGEPLADILDRLAAGDRSTRDRFPLGALIALFQKVCDAIAFAHSRDVVHCALRPESVTVGSYGKVYVANWSFAKILPATDARHVNTINVETPPPPLSHYTAPEQAVAAPDSVDTRTDIYALGGILHRIVTLVDPLDDRGKPTQRRICPHWPDSQLPEGLLQIAAKALSTSRSDRHETVLALQHEIIASQDGTHPGPRQENIWKQVTGMLRL